MRRAERVLLPGALALAFLLAMPALARAPGSATVGAAVEAWHRVQAACTLPVGCPPAGAPAPPSPYPDGTLHVGVAAGQESDRTYLVLDLGRLPFDATLTGGTLTVPVSVDGGSASAASAAMRACLATAAAAPADGAVSPGPAVDCDVSSPASYRAGERPVFEVDLAPFASPWSVTNTGLALVPAAGQAPTASWHVAFDSRSGPSPVSASIDFERPDATTAATAPSTFSPTRTSPPTTAPEEAAGDGEELFAGPAGEGGIGLDLAAPPPRPTGRIVADASSAAAVRSGAVVVTDTGFRYSVVFLLPLVLLVVGGALAHGLTRPVLGEDGL